MNSGRLVEEGKKKKFITKGQNIKKSSFGGKGRMRNWKEASVAGRQAL